MLGLRSWHWNHVHSGPIGSHAMAICQFVQLSTKGSIQLLSRRIGSVACRMLGSRMPVCRLTHPCKNVVAGRCGLSSTGAARCMHEPAAGLAKSWGVLVVGGHSLLEERSCCAQVRVAVPVSLSESSTTSGVGVCFLLRVLPRAGCAMLPPVLSSVESEPCPSRCRWIYAVLARSTASAMWAVALH